MMRTKIAAICVLAAACTSEPTSSVELIQGFQPPAPGPHDIQFVIPPIRDIPAGADQTFCTYLDYRSAKDLDIYDYVGAQSKLGAHHALLYAVDNNQPANTHICNEDDMINARYLAGGGADAPPQYLPDGVVIRMPANTQIMIQTHWINESDNMIDGQAAFNLSVEDTSPEHVNAQLFTAPATQFTLPPGAGSTRSSCTVQQQLNFFLLGGHEHEWGTHITIHVTRGGDAQMVYDTVWNKEYQFNPPRNYYTKDEPFTMNPGDRIDVDCSYNNTTGANMIFPTEMCVGWGYFFPATEEIDCVDGEWPSGT